MAFNAPGQQRQGILSNIPPFSSIAHNRPSVQQPSPAPGSLLSNQLTAPGLNNRPGVGLGMGSFGANTNVIPVGHLHQPHQAPQQPNQQEASLDPSEFPALGAGPPSSNNPSNAMLSYASHVNIPSTNGISADRPVNNPRSDFTPTPDDFPALDVTTNQQQQQQQQQQQLLVAEGNSAREAREQASAAAALTTQMARLNAVHTKPTGLADTDHRRSYPIRLTYAQQTFMMKASADPNQVFSGAAIGSSHLSNGTAHQPVSHHGLHLTLPTGPIPPSNSHLHSILRSPIPPNLQNLPLQRPNNLSLHPSNAGPNPMLLHTPASPNQTLQDPSAHENASGASDPSSQPTPSLDNAASLDSSHHLNQNQANTENSASLESSHHLNRAPTNAPFYPPQTPAEQVLFGPADRFGLMGLLHIIKNADPDYSMLALGKDLTHLGLDLGSSDYKKNWRYHKELQLWLTKESGTGPMEKTPHYERGYYVFFDPIIWKRVTKEFVLQYDQLEAKPALATNPAALGQAGSMSLVYTTNGAQGNKNALTASGPSNSNAAAQPPQQQQQQQQVGAQQQQQVSTQQHAQQQQQQQQQHRMMISSTNHPNMVPA